ncbi:unnamed protein product [Boreogadus saida]
MNAPMDKKNEAINKLFDGQVQSAIVKTKGAVTPYKVNNSQLIESSCQNSETKRPFPVNAVVHLRNLPVCVISAKMTTCRLLLLSLALLIILTEMSLALFVFAAVFIDSNEVTISPFNFCSKGQNGKILSCQPVPSTTVYLCLYVPVVLVPFALLSSLLSYGEEDSSVLRLSMWCQAAASALSLLGLVWFVGLHWAYASQSAMTVYYYCCVLVTAELAVTTYLSYVLTQQQQKKEEEHNPH